MTYPHGLSWGRTYTLTGPDGTVAVFNDDTSPYYVGILDPNGSSGLDGADVRENADDLPDTDGGVHGPFYEGRRPVVLAGQIIASSVADRDAKVDRLRRASFALRDDAVLKWTPTGGEEIFTSLRRQQPLRVTGGYLKSFQLSMVAADPRLYSTTLFSQALTSSGVVSITNNGDATSPPRIVINGNTTAPVITNNTLSKSIAILAGTNIPSGHNLAIDVGAGTILYDTTTNRYGYLDFANTDWWGVAPGSNSIAVGTIASGTIYWRNAYL